MITKNRSYQIIAKNLIKRLPEFEDLRIYAPKIAFLSSDEEKIQNHRTIFGTCTKTSKQYTWTCPYDFFITIYEPNIASFSSDQLETLIRHELHHIGVETEGNEPSFYCKPHDYEEFEDIIRDKGIDWAEK